MIGAFQWTLGDKTAGKHQVIKPGLRIGTVVLSLVAAVSILLMFGERFLSGNIEPSQGVLTPTTNVSSPVLPEVSPKTARLLDGAGNFSSR